MEKSTKIILIILLVVIIGSISIFYNPKEELKQEEIIEEVNEPEEPIEEESELLLEEPEEQVLEQLENKIIKVTQEGFIPQDLTIIVGQEVTWQNKGVNSFMIACYKNGIRTSLGERIWDEQGQYTNKFSQRGEYLCIDSIYGLRGTVIVNPAVSNLITGNVVALGDISVTQINGLVSLIAIIGVILGLSLYFHKKK